MLSLKKLLRSSEEADTDPNPPFAVVYGDERSELSPLIADKLNKLLKKNIVHQPLSPGLSDLSAAHRGQKPLNCLIVISQKSALLEPLTFSLHLFKSQNLMIIYEDNDAMVAKPWLVEEECRKSLETDKNPLKIDVLILTKYKFELYQARRFWDFTGSRPPFVEEIFFKTSPRERLAEGALHNNDGSGSPKMIKNYSIARSDTLSDENLPSNRSHPRRLSRSYISAENFDSVMLDKMTKMQEEIKYLKERVSALELNQNPSLRPSLPAEKPRSGSLPPEGHSLPPQSSPGSRLNKKP